MIRPIEYSISIIRRSNFDVTFRLLEEEGGSPLDWSAYTILSQLWDRTRQTKYLNFDIDVTNLSIGVFTLKLTADRTATLPLTGVYDVKVIFSDLTEYFFIKGNFTVTEGYTDD